MAQQHQFRAADGVAFREFLKRCPEEKLRSIVMEQCPAKVTAVDILDKPADGIARIAAMRTGWEECLDALFAMAQSQQAPEVAPEFRDMS